MVQCVQIVKFKKKLNFAETKFAASKNYFQTHCTFDPDTECTGIHNPVISETECCGEYTEGRRPFRVSSGLTTRSCCSNTVINHLIQECCFGVPSEFGSGCPTENLARGTEIGCYVDAPARDMIPTIYINPGYTMIPSNQPEGSIEHCISKCSDDGHLYAGVQAGSTCFCSDTFGSYGTGTGCTYVCNDLTDDFCGGSWRNLVFKT